MNLVCNAGPIIALAKINLLPLLEQLGFSSVVIPQTVFTNYWQNLGLKQSEFLKSLKLF
jgi:predicted nucleic acid-binding protein